MSANSSFLPKHSKDEYKDLPKRVHHVKGTFHVNTMFCRHRSTANSHTGECSRSSNRKMANISTYKGDTELHVQRE